jgi:Holliday junction resolvase RusA-like endonuclease|nr:MAG TPA: Endodeoxyribonuclease RusA [Caudoviricetes sp.]
MTNNRIDFTIHGECVPKARPRFSKYGHIYTTPKTRAYENIVKTTAIDNNVPCITTALNIKIMVYKSIPKSFSKEKRRLAEMGKILPTVKPDVDNYVKAILDGLNGILFIDDKQICDLSVGKRYSNYPRVEVTAWSV